jgi:hypothetical protein
MPPPEPAKNAPPPRPTYPLAGLLSFMIPGLGQIYQGRLGKGVLFFVCIYALFFYGMALGDWKNVYIPHTFHTAGPPDIPVIHDSPVLTDLFNRLQYLGQFWAGAVAWPAILQYKWYDEANHEAQDKNPPLHGFERQPPENKNRETGEDGLNELQTKGDKTWDLAWVYTVIAGVLNILVIYDAYAGPAFHVEEESKRKPQPGGAAA